MRRKFPARACDRCGKSISERADGSGLRAHKCPHGVECVAPAWTHPDDARKHDVGCDVCKARVRQLTDLEAVIIELGFAIEDPCPPSAIELARALVKFAQRVPEEQRGNAIATLNLIGCMIAAQ